MQFATAYDLEHQDAIELPLLLHKMYMETPFLVNLPDGSTTYGVIEEINQTPSKRIVELVIEIPDTCAHVFYIDHDPNTTSLVRDF